ncbi:MAG: BCD family MFS transporter [Chloroflexota bacterium]
MTILKNIRLGLLHVAVAITFVAINGVLNRIMIADLGILSTIVAALIILPYVLSPAQVWLGAYSDQHPIFGYRRSPYILLGMILCFGGMVLTPYAATELAVGFWNGLPLGVLAFGLWGVGYNLAVVSYLSLASDLSEEHQRSRTIAVMWFMMIASIIASAIIIGSLLEPYSQEQLIRVFFGAAGVGLALTAIGLVGLEPRLSEVEIEKRDTHQETIAAVINNPQARIFFIYLVLMLCAILGQDVLLEPYGAQTFGMTVEETTQLTALWGGTTLVALLTYGFVLTRFMSKKTGAMLGGAIATVGLVLIALAGTAPNMAVVFQPGIAILGFGTGIATSTNLALMLDMTTAAQAGLFIGAWGVADAASRGVGMMLGGIVRDIVGGISGDATLGYITVFLIEAGFLLLSLALLTQINTAEFQGRKRRAPTMLEVAAISGD